MSITQIIENDSIFSEITSYLHFEDKIILSKTIKKNCLKKYNFDTINFHNNNIYDIFTSYNEESNGVICEYMYNLSSHFLSEITKCCDDYCDYDRENYIMENYNNFVYGRDRELIHLLHKTYMKVYTRKVVEYVENNNLHVPSYYDYDFFELETKENIDIYNSVMEYYKHVFENELMGIFCDKCGLFGHCSTSKKCIFYNESHQNEIKNVDYMITK